MTADSADGAKGWTGRIERLDRRFSGPVPAKAVPEVIADFSSVPGSHWLEGPVWDLRTGSLLFSDVKGNTIWRWSAAGGIRPFLHPSGYTGPQPAPMEEPGSNGLVFDRQGRLVMCEHGDRRVTRLDADGRKTVLADRWQGKRLNSPNDVVLRRNGELWFTDPPYGLPGRFDDPGKELPFNGVYRIAADGTLSLMLDTVKIPNGIAFSPDETVLYVTESDPDRVGWLAFPLHGDGTIGEGRLLFAGSRLSGLGGPDGMVVDKDGVIFAAGFEGVHVLDPDGTHLGSIRPGSLTSNVAWGEDGSTLFITADQRLLRLRTTTRGAGI
jgi:gluconolactonase